MWGFQSHFRHSLQSVAEHAFQSIGVYAAPEALLIGFQEEGESDWPICIEPENREYHPEILKNVLAIADQLFANHPDAGLIYSDTASFERMIKNREEECRRDAIAQALSSSSAGAGRLFYVGYPRRVRQYRVYPVISVVSSAWERLPHLAHEHRDGRLTTIESLQYAVAEEVVRTASAELNRLTPPEDWSDWPHVIASDVIRRASQRFLSVLVAVHGSWEGTEFMTAMDAVAAQPYEGRTALGSIILTKRTHEALSFDLMFDPPLSVRRSRVFRKALEMSSVDMALITDGMDIFGLGRLLESYDPDAENAYDVTVTSRGTWEISHNNAGLMRVDNGRVLLPKERISREVFIDTARRVLGEDVDPAELWSQVRGAADQQHGTMLVVHRNADTEADRLRAQATLIEPRKLSGNALAAVTSIDGAILLRPDGTCVAVGVILDGVAGPDIGDAARGARYNSGVRYQAAANEKGCLVVIVSEDGMINLVPELPRQVKRSTVERAVQMLEAAAEATDVDFEVASNRADHVASLTPYLTPAQGARYNAAQLRIAAARRQSGGIIEVGWRKLDVGVDPDESLFFEE
ncbi:hypothetical protein [Microbacterium galbum]|uniref:hypothetical protein n=1 Tax=Microbacterium galbum TaxID=3075994 RepID=UPI00345F7D9C